MMMLLESSFAAKDCRVIKLEGKEELLIKVLIFQEKAAQVNNSGAFLLTFFCWRKWRIFKN